MLTSTANTLLALALVAGGSVNALPQRWGHANGVVTTTTVAVPAPSPVVSIPAPVSVPPAYGGGESHKVELINRCGGNSRAVFLYRDDPKPQTGLTLPGPLYGGVAWVENHPTAVCGSSGVGCGTVEFSLINPGTDGGNTDSSVNYSLQDQGDHKYTYPMHFTYTGTSSVAAPGPCVGPGNVACPGAFTGPNTASGTPVNILVANAGIRITFC